MDNGRGGPFIKVYDSVGYSSIYSYKATDAIECGYLYNVRVSAINTAGEGAFIQEHVWVGVPPTAPLNPRMSSVVPMTSLVLEWYKPLSDGCLPILSYTI